MSVRGVWVVTVGTEESPPRCLFARRYPTVERRAQLQSSQYTSLPADNELIISLLSVATQQHATFSETRDSCVGSHSSPVYWLGEGKLGPLVVIHSSDHLLAALGVDQQSVPCALSMLEAMAELITDPLDLTELRSFLSVCAPFGTPLDLRPSNAINRLTPVPAKVKPLSDLQKSPGWSVCAC
ncbi:AP-5 complex subunit mu-1-like [Halichondria panicea]|uniref:AP-5 complex subunit mu-1-like n=1 Tax=Halichondria panicea TaxID=6063 RepID=UPI00312B320E